MSTEFRHIEHRHRSTGSDKLFRAAISAFCALTRPSRRELAQLEDLCFQLYETASPEALRYASAALSECEHAPAALIRRLADEPIDIAAPLLLKSPQLAEIDMIAIIGRHGASHARVVAQRAHLPKRVADLAGRSEARPKPEATETKAESTRQALRRMMRPATLSEEQAANPTRIYGRLRATALTGNASFFRTALADALAIDIGQARMIVEGQDRRPLALCLKALSLSAEEAFLIAAALLPQRFQHSAAIRTFTETYEALTAEEALRHVRLLQADGVFGAMAHRSAAPARSGRAA